MGKAGKGPNGSVFPHLHMHLHRQRMWRCCLQSSQPCWKFRVISDSNLKPAESGWSLDLLCTSTDRAQEHLQLPGSVLLSVQNKVDSAAAERLLTEV